MKKEKKMSAICEEIGERKRSWRARTDLPARESVVESSRMMAVEAEKSRR